MWNIEKFSCKRSQELLCVLSLQSVSGPEVAYSDLVLCINFYNWMLQSAHGGIINSVFIFVNNESLF